MSYVELMKAGSVRPFVDFVGVMYTFNAGMHAYVLLIYSRLKARAQSDQLRATSFNSFLGCLWLAMCGL